MLHSFKFSGEAVSGIAFVGILALSMTVMGCGGGEGGESGVVVRARRESIPVSRLELPRPETEETSVTGETVEADTVVTVTQPEAEKEVTYEEAEAAYQERHYEEAVELFSEYAERRSENPWGFYMLGLSAWKAGEPAVAEKAFNRALELDPGHVKSQLNLSRVYLDAGRSKDALTMIDKVLAIDPESGEAYRLQGRALSQSGLVDSAVGAYRHAILIDDEDYWAMNNLGLIFIEEGRFADALPPLARAVELKDDVAILQNNLGMALEGTRHYRSAEEAYRSATLLDGSHGKALNNLNRVEIVVEDSWVEPIDLKLLALDFKDEIAGWSAVAVSSESPVVSTPEEVIAIEADSPENGQE